MDALGYRSLVYSMWCTCYILLFLVFMSYFWWFILFRQMIKVRNNQFTRKKNRLLILNLSGNVSTVHEVRNGDILKVINEQ